MLIMRAGNTMRDTRGSNDRLRWRAVGGGPNIERVAGMWAVDRSSLFRFRGSGDEGV